VSYLAYRKAIQAAVQAQLAAWGEAREREDRARRRVTRPIEKDLEGVLMDLADDFPAVGALVERRAGGQRRLPTGGDPEPRGMAGAAAADAAERAARGEAGREAGAGETSHPGTTLDGGRPGGGEPPTLEAAAESPSPVSTGVLPLMDPARGAPKRPTRYALGIEFEERPGSAELGRLVESTVLVNTAHAAYRRAVASRSEGYHAALTVGMALAAVAVEAERRQAFLSTFLERWGGALDRDRRRRKERPRRGRGS
jgi:hypothetical protein